MKKIICIILFACAATISNSAYVDQSQTGQKESLKIEWTNDLLGLASDPR